jgi:hypothetical protein
MRFLPFLLLLSCNPPPTDLGDAQTVTPTTLQGYLGRHVTVTGTPTPTRVVEHGPPGETCRLFYLMGNRKLFVDDCSSRVPEPVEGTPSFTGRLMLFSTLPQASDLSAYYRDHFAIKVVPETTYVIIPDS